MQWPNIMCDPTPQAHLHQVPWSLADANYNQEYTACFHEKENHQAQSNHDSNPIVPRARAFRRTDDRPWILSTFSHGIYMFLESFTYIWIRFRVSTSSGTHLRKMMYLGKFGDFSSALLETEKESIIESEYRPASTKNNRSTEGSYHQSTAKPPAS